MRIFHSFICISVYSVITRVSRSEDNSDLKAILVRGKFILLFSFFIQIIVSIKLNVRYLGWKIRAHKIGVISYRISQAHCVFGCLRVKQHESETGF